MGLFDLFKKKAPVQKQNISNIQINEEKGGIYQPIDGEIITLEEIGDGVFSSGAMGGGCGIRPFGEAVYAPASGEITVIADTMHAVGMTADNGMDLLIHVGMDTVSMNGKGFSVKVKVGDHVQAGQLLMTFDRKAIAAAGVPDTTAFILLSEDDFQRVEKVRNGMGNAGEKVYQLS